MPNAPTTIGIISVFFCLFINGTHSWNRHFFHSGHPHPNSNPTLRYISLNIRSAPKYAIKSSVSSKICINIKSIVPSNSTNTNYKHNSHQSDNTYSVFVFVVECVECVDVETDNVDNGNDDDHDDDSNKTPP